MRSLPSRVEAGLNALPQATPSTAASATRIFAALAAHITQPPAKRDDDSSCSSTPNAVLLDIQTSVLIPDYDSFYTTPIYEFKMTYTKFPDGSLVAPPFLEESRREDWLLLFTGMMLMLFTITSIISMDYTRRGRVRFKGLFYALILSQVFAVIYFVLLAIQILDEDPNCARYVILYSLTFSKY